MIVYSDSPTFIETHIICLDCESIQEEREPERAQKGRSLAFRGKCLSCGSGSWIPLQRLRHWKWQAPEHTMLQTTELMPALQEQPQVQPKVARRKLALAS